MIQGNYLIVIIPGFLILILNCTAYFFLISNGFLSPLLGPTQVYTNYLRKLLLIPFFIWLTNTFHLRSALDFAFREESVTVHFFLQRNQNRLEKMVPSLFSIYLHFKAINQGLFPIQVLNLFFSLFLLS